MLIKNIIRRAPSMTLFLIINIMISLSCIASFQATKSDLDPNKTTIKWKKDLKRYPIPERGIELHPIISFPTKKLEEKGIFFAKVLTFNCDKDMKNIFAADTRTNKILIFDTNGKFITQIGQQGSGPGEFLMPRHIGVDRDGRLFVHDLGNRRIQIFDSQGKFLESFKIFKSISSMDVSEKGHIYANTHSQVDNANYLIEVFNSKGRLLRSFGSPLYFKNYTSPYTSAHNEIKISISPREEVVMAWHNYDYLRIYSKQGELLNETQIEHKYANKKSKENKKAKMENGRIIFFTIISDIVATENNIYVLISYPRIEVLKYNYDLSLENVYYFNPPERSLWGDLMVIKKKDEKLMFYILQWFPENKIHVFSN